MSVFLRRTVPRVALVLIASIAFVQRLPGQQRSQSDHPIVPVIGIVKSISGNVISVDAGERIVAVFANEHSEIWKGKYSMTSRWSRLATTLRGAINQTFPPAS